MPLGYDVFFCWGSYLGPCGSIYVQHSMRRKWDVHHGEGLAVGLSRINADDSGTLDNRLDYNDHVQRRHVPTGYVKRQ